MFFRLTFLSLLLSISLLGNSSFGSISSGTQNGTYYKVAKDISTIFKKYKADLKVLPSEGSIDNLDALIEKQGKDKAQWAIIQSDAFAYYQLTKLKDKKQNINKLVKTALPLYTEHIHIFSKANKKINFKKGTKLRVGISSETSDSNITAAFLEKAYQVKFEYQYVKFKTALKYLQDDKLDILINVMPYPNKNFKKLKGVTLVALPHNKIMDKRYLRTSFSTKRFPWLKKDVEGYKVPTVLVTNQVSTKQNQSVGIYLKIILNNYKALIQYGHPIWREAYRNRSLKIDNMHPVAFNLLHK